MAEPLDGIPTTRLPVETKNGPDLATEFIHGRRRASLQLLGTLGGLGAEDVEPIGRSHVGITHRGPGDSLNCTGTRPAP